MAMNDFAGGVVSKEELQRKNEVREIVQKEQKRYNPAHTNSKITFQHQRLQLEKMIDDGYKVDLEANLIKKPITEIAKIHSEKLFALAKDDDKAQTPPYNAYIPNTDVKYKDKWNVVNGVLVVGDKKKNVWVTQSGQEIDLQAPRGPSAGDKARMRWK